MTKEEKEAVLHCLRAMIDEELCEECPLYGMTGTDHCEKDCVRLAIEELEQKPCEDKYIKEIDHLRKYIVKLETQIIEQEPCEDEYIKVPKKALKYRTTGMVAYNAEWLKAHFDLERAVICGEQEPCDDCISRVYIEPIIEELENICVNGDEHILNRLADIKNAPPVTPQSKTGRWIHHKEKEFVCAEHWECSQCHRTTMTYPFSVNGNDYDTMYYCPKCGAKMVEDTGSEG